jgi:hypothetical protein
MENQSFQNSPQLNCEIESNKKIYKLKKLKLKLRDKKEIVEKYLEFMNNGGACVNNTLDPVNEYQQFSKEDSELKESESIEEKTIFRQQQTSIRAFLVQFNRGKPVVLDVPSVYRWLKSFNRGEYEELNGENDLNKLKCNSEKILKIMGKSLKRKFPDSAVWNKLAKSKNSPDHYGVFAKKDIPSGTMLGFFNGKEAISVAKLVGPHKYKLNDYTHVDGSDFVSCFARYYVSSSKEEKQNVTVQRLKEWSDSNRAICFIANKDISAGSELIIASDQDYVRNKYKPPKVDLRYKDEAAGLAAAFGK